MLSSVGRAAPLQGVGREFETLSIHHSIHDPAGVPRPQGLLHSGRLKALCGSLPGSRAAFGLRCFPPSFSLLSRQFALLTRFFLRATVLRIVRPLGEHNRQTNVFDMTLNRSTQLAAAGLLTKAHDRLCLLSLSLLPEVLVVLPRSGKACVGASAHAVG